MSKLEAVLVAIIILLLLVLGGLLFLRNSGSDASAFRVSISGARTATIDDGAIFYEFSEGYFYDDKRLTFPDLTTLTIQNGNGAEMQLISITIPVDTAPGTYALTTPVNLSHLPAGAAIPGDHFEAGYYAPDGASFVGAVSGQITLTEAGEQISGSFDFSASTLDPFTNQTGNEAIRAVGTFEDIALKR